MEFKYDFLFSEENVSKSHNLTKAKVGKFMIGAKKRKLELPSGLSFGGSPSHPSEDLSYISA